MPITEVNILNSDSKVFISKDEMSANIFMVNPPDGQKYTVEDIIALLNNNGINQGIDKELIEQIAVHNMLHKEICVARGKGAEDGTDGEFELLFRTELPSSPLMLKDGSVDYLNMDIFEQVKEDQLIAKYNKATMGKMGYTVLGKLLIPKKGKDKPAIRGKGFKISEDGLEYYSKMNGQINLIGGLIVISNIFTVSGDLTHKVGNINFEGDVVIKGGIQSGMKVSATGCVMVDGIVEGAIIIAGKDIVLKQGALGGSKGYIEAGQNIFGKFFEATKVRCKKTLICNYLMNCDVEAGESIEITGKKGAIIAGQTKALSNIKVYTIGNAKEISTALCVGSKTEYINRYQEIEKQLKKVDSEIIIFQEALEKRVNLKDKIALALSMKNDERKVLLEEKVETMEKITIAIKASITATAIVFPGSQIKIDTEVLPIKTKLKNVNFKKKDAHIAIYKN